MLDDFSATQRLFLGLAVAPVVYLLAVGIGRFLKRRVGVKLGVMYQLLCVVLALYAPIAALIPGSPPGVVHESERALLGALIVLGAFFILALFGRFLWEGYFEKRRSIIVPNFVREVLSLVVFIVAVIIVMDAVYNLSIEGILAGSGVAAIILGLAMQDLLGSIIAGVSLEVGRPFRVGDWLKVDQDYAQVIELNWRSVRLRTNDDILLDIPNNEIVKHTIINLNYPVKRYAMRLELNIDYNVPPNVVKDIFVRAAENAVNVLKQPKPKAFLRDFGESSITYQLKFYMESHRRYNDTMDSVRCNIWYELKRAGIRIPYPIRTVRIERPERQTGVPTAAAARALQRQEIFGCLSADQIAVLVGDSVPQRFGRLERIIVQGSDGDSMFVLVEGEADVCVDTGNGADTQVATLRDGDCFGEISLLTGAKRSATIVARSDCEVLEIGKDRMAALLEEHPEVLEALSELFAKRQLETEGVIASTTKPEEMIERQKKYSESFIQKFSSYFGL